MACNRIKIPKKKDWNAIMCGLILLTALVSLLFLVDAARTTILADNFSLDKDREPKNPLHFGTDNCSPGLKMDNCSPAINTERIHKGDTIAVASGSGRAINNIEILSN